VSVNLATKDLDPFRDSPGMWPFRQQARMATKITGELRTQKRGPIGCPMIFTGHTANSLASAQELILRKVPILIFKMGTFLKINFFMIAGG
jgi:hypothetical protein